jgi:hypothetical protein
MLDDAEKLPGCRLIRFEDLVSDPRPMIAQLYAWTELDPDKIRQMRFKAKEHYVSRQSRQALYPVGSHHWIDLDKIEGFLDPQITTYHISHVPAEETRFILEETRQVRERLGY